MSRLVVRFIGDPTGYIVTPKHDSTFAAPGDLHDQRWTPAKVGHTDREVWINIAQAYLIATVGDEA